MPTGRHLNGLELADAGPDITDPLIVGLEPADDSEAILGGDLVATFDDAIDDNTGNSSQARICDQDRRFRRYSRLIAPDQSRGDGPAVVRDA